ncbi:MAG: SulP family inorganic anion transporter [Pseudooceanicola sp.]
MRPKILTTLPGYTGALFKADALAGLSVALVALPLSLAIAIASGAPPGAGLVTAVVAGFLISALGGSRVQIGGPTGAFIVVVFGVIAEHGYDGLVIATLMAGVILVIAGLIRAGALIRWIPEAVINGFTIGIAVIIGTSQVKDALGLVTPPLSADFIPKVAEMWEARSSLSPAALGVTAATMVLIVLFRRAAPKLPGLVVAVALTSGVAAWMELPVDTIAGRFGALPDRLPMPHWPELGWDRVVELLPSALVIAFLAGIESLLSAMVADRMIGGSHRPNAEIIAQGAANIGSAFFGGLPATGAIARTATNVRAGGQTPVAGMIHALVILAIMMMAAPLAGMLAMPALAGVLLLTAWNMAEPQHWRAHLALPRADLVVLALTLVLTVVTDLTVAIGVGVAAGLAIRLRRRSVPPADWTPPDR